jgi:hypothetical protein
MEGKPMCKGAQDCPSLYLAYTLINFSPGDWLKYRALTSIPAALNGGGVQGLIFIISGLFFKDYF